MMAGLLILILEILEKRRLIEHEAPVTFFFFRGGLEAQELLCTGLWPEKLVRDFWLFLFKSRICDFIYSA